MRIALLSDIHGNEVAFDAVLEKLKNQQIDQYVVMGDLAYRGPSPKACIQKVQKLNGKVIRGNADEWILRGVKKGEVPDQALELMQTEREWAYNQLSDNELNFLNDLPTSYTIHLENNESLFVCHATPTSLFDVVPPNSSDQKLEQAFVTKENQDSSLIAYGHIHLPYLRSFSGKKIINTGSIGLPFDGDNRASFIIIDSKPDETSIRFERLTYDISLAVSKLSQENYPEDAIPLLSHIYKHGKRPS